MEFCSGYFDELVGPTRARYEAKIAMCSGVDPYKLHIGRDATTDTEVLPPTTHVDIINYLVLSTSYISLQQMKSYKSLDAHNYFTSGFVKNIAAKKLSSQRVVVLAEVNHSQRLREPALKAWVLADDDGSIVTAHCTCMAGAGEACSHVGATLFAVETAVRVRDAKTCTEKENSWLPANNSTVTFKRLRDIDFSSSQAKKKRIDSVHLASTQPSCGHLPATQPHTSVDATAADLDSFYSKLANSGTRSAVLMVHPKYQNMFESPCRKMPLLLRSVTCPEAQSENLEELVQRAEKFVADLSVTAEIVQHVEEMTRQQSSCANWYAYRAGRVTASEMKSVYSTNIVNPSVSLVKKICYPEEHKFSTAATAWGQAHESDAIAHYVQEMRKNHQDFTHSRTGVFLSPGYPYLAATPDASVSCKCCGKGVAEVKCPYSLAQSGILNVANSQNFCLENSDDGALHLKRSHRYFFQVQTQMAVCNVSYCDFIVWTPSSTHIERVHRDDAFIDTLLPCARNFFLRAIMPELFAKYFSRKSAVLCASNNTNAKVFCYCQGPEVGKMLACDGSLCKYKWFHYTCLGIKRAPRQKQWFCEDCKQP